MTYYYDIGYIVKSYISSSLMYLFLLWHLMSLYLDMLHLVTCMDTRCHYLHPVNSNKKKMKIPEGSLSDHEVVRLIQLGVKDLSPGQLVIKILHRMETTGQKFCIYF